MSVIDNSSLAVAGMPGIHHVTLAGSANGLKHLSVWRQRLDPGSSTPPHRHDCEEVVLIERGRGELHIQGEVCAFGPDTTLVVPPDAAHQIFNVGTEPLELVGIFACAPVEVFSLDGEALALPWQS